MVFKISRLWNCCKFRAFTDLVQNVNPEKASYTVIITQEMEV